MKAFACALFLAVIAVPAVAQPSTIVADTSLWKNGESQTFTLDETVHITVRRDGDIRRVTVMRLGMTNEYTIEPIEGRLQVTSRNTNRGVLISPHRITVDGVNLEGELRFPSQQRGTADPLIIDTSKMEENQKVTSTHDGTTVTVVRRGDTRHVLVENGKLKDEIIITRKADGFSVGTVKRGESFMVRPLRIIVDGIPIEPFVDNLLVPRGGKATYYVCPFDGTIVRAGTHDLDELKCPIDGMVMQPRTGPPNKIFLLDKD